MSQIPQRLASFRALMTQEDLDVLIVPSTDEHLNEYLPTWNSRREWLSGFSGSAGDLCVELKGAWLFTDARYHIQAEKELEHSTIQLSRVGTQGALTLIEHLEKRARENNGTLRVGYDPRIMSAAMIDAFRARLEPSGATLKQTAGSIVDEIWDDRPSPATTPLIKVPDEWSGRSTSEKLDDLRGELKKANAAATVLVKLDQIAWLLNARSEEDVPFNPVFEAFVYVDMEECHLFARNAEARVTQELRKSWPKVVLHEYDSVWEFLSNTSPVGGTLIDPNGVTDAIRQAFQNTKIIEQLQPVEMAKALKNPVEIERMKRAGLLASAAKTRALMWLRLEIDAGRTMTELRFQNELHRLYSECEDYRGLSFTSIAGTGPHGAIMHYKDADDTVMEDHHLFLIDSGIHASGGTTDDTRTVAIRDITQDLRLYYTSVLKAHIHAAQFTFPKNTAGSAVDVMARAPLWANHMKYDHGTGHGVGCWLNVHEGPFTFAEVKRKSFAKTPLEKGMIASIEPGFYMEGSLGIRLENLYVIVESTSKIDQATYFSFESLTWIPFDERLIDPSLLNRDEEIWLDEYDKELRVKLGSVMSQDDIEKIPHWRNS